MNRRMMLAAAAALVGTLAFAVPALTQAQAPKRILVALFLQGGYNASTADLLTAFHDGMKDAGLVVGRDYDFISRYGNDQADRMPAIAQEIVAMKPDVIVTQATLPPPAVLQATSTIPVVAAVGEGQALRTFGDLQKRTNNLTGIIGTPTDTASGQFAIVREALPNVTRVGWIDWTAQPTDRAARQSRIDEAMKTHRMTEIRAEIAGAADIPAAINKLKAEGAQVIVMVPATLSSSESARIIQMATAAGLPTVWPGFNQARDGGLLSYGVGSAKYMRDAGPQVVAVLKGAKPGDLPVTFNPRYELTVNTKTAAALGITLPPALVARADRVFN